MTVAFTNFASTRTTSILLAGGTAVSVTPGSGANFPATAGGAWFYLVLTDSLTAPTVREVIKVTNRSTDSMATLVRAQDGTTALEWPAGSYCELRLTKGALEDIVTASLQAADNLSDLTDQVAARANLQLGSIATQNSNNVSISGGLLSSCEILGGTLDVTPIGGVAPDTGAFTDLAASGTVSGAGFAARFSTPGPIGDGTPDAGIFTTLEATVSLAVNGNPANGFLYSGASGFVLGTLAATDGQVLIGRTGFPPAAANITGTSGQITVTNGAGSIALSAPTMVSRLSVNVTPVGNVGGGTDDLMTYALPANSLSANGKGVRVTISGRVANNANAKTLTFMFGAATVNIALRSTLDQAWFAVFHVIRTGSNTQIITGDTHTSVANLTATNEGAVVDTTATETDSGAITIKCTAAGVADNDVVQKLMMVEFVN